MTGAFEAARRNPVTGLLACAVGFAAVLVLAYWADPVPRWDESLLLAVRASPGTFANDFAFAVERLVSPLAQVGWTVLAALLALWLRRPRLRPATAAIGAAFTLAVSVGLLVLDYHYPSDVVGGWLVALGWCFALVALQRWKDGRTSAAGQRRTV